MNRKLAVIGVGNMAKAVISGISKSDIEISDILVYDKNPEQYISLSDLDNIIYTQDISNAIENADIVLIAVKPQNYNEVLDEFRNANGYSNKLYISIGAGVTSYSVSSKLDGACVIRVLPNIPMIIGQGVSVICQNDSVSKCDFDFVCDIFRCAGSVLLINESEMNRTIGITSSSPAYVFKFIDAIYQGALAQGVTDNDLICSICDMIIGSANLLKSSDCAPAELISKVASKGGTTESALLTLDEYDFDNAIKEAMLACTKRAEELGNLKN